jgi:hypothetical protein
MPGNGDWSSAAPLEAWLFEEAVEDLRHWLDRVHVGHDAERRR